MRIRECEYDGRKVSLMIDDRDRSLTIRFLMRQCIRSTQFWIIACVAKFLPDSDFEGEESLLSW